MTYKYFVTVLQYIFFRHPNFTRAFLFLTLLFSNVYFLHLIANMSLILIRLKKTWLLLCLKDTNDVDRSARCRCSFSFRFVLFLIL